MALILIGLTLKLSDPCTVAGWLLRSEQPTCRSIRVRSSALLGLQWLHDTGSATEKRVGWRRSIEETRDGDVDCKVLGTMGSISELGKRFCKEANQTDALKVAAKKQSRRNSGN